MMQRAIRAGAIGLFCGFLSYARLTLSHVGAGDFAWPLWGARLLLRGDNPYDLALLSPHLPYAPDAPLFYPLPALWLVAPLTVLPDTVAAGVFVGLGCAILAWALTKVACWPLFLFLSPAMYASISNAQWSPLLTAALLLPALAPLAVVKPNLGAAVFAARPSWRLLCACGGVLAMSVLTLPSWSLDWLQAVRASPHVSPVTILPFGPLLLLPLLRWRDPDARLFLALALLPNRMAFYDQLGLLTIPRTPRALLACLILQWIAFYAMPGAWWDVSAHPWIVALCYLPVLMFLSMKEASSLLGGFRCGYLRRTAPRQQ